MNLLFVLIFSATIFSGVHSHAAPSTLEVYSLGPREITQRVSSNNFTVYESALKIYQAKTNIDKARADLLPRLNLWNVAGMILDPVSILSNVNDVAPFLVPSNWFRLEEIKLLYLAEKEAYRALWGNELHIAKSLYFNILLDGEILSHIDQSLTELEKVHRIIKTREIFGSSPPGAARDIEIRILGLRQDKENLKLLIKSELNSLSYSLGFPLEQKISLKPLEKSNPTNWRPIVSSEYEFRLLSTSPERRQFSHFLSVISQIKKEMEYSFLGASTISRGVAGGVFDFLPTGNSLGLGKDSAVKIADTQKKIIETQRTGIEETLKRQLQNTVEQYNSDLDHHASSSERLKLTQQKRDSLLRRVQLGENINTLELSESLRDLIQSETSLLSLQFRILTLQDRFDRLLFQGDYRKKPPVIESLQGKPQ